MHIESCHERGFDCDVFHAHVHEIVGNWTSTDDEARCAMACSPRSVQRRDIR